jgi:hypothetical protein
MLVMEVVSTAKGAQHCSFRDSRFDFWDDGMAAGIAVPVIDLFDDEVSTVIDDDASIRFAGVFDFVALENHTMLTRAM